jgi:hypothetical protein
MGVKDSKLKFQLVDPDDIKTVVSTKYAIEDYLVLNESTFVFGPPKHLKTFLVLSWLLCIATGLDWFGHKVRRLKVLYFIGEGVDPFMGRIKAWQIANHVPDLDQYFKVVRRVPNLFDGSLESTISEIKAQGFIPDVIAIDTLGRAMGAAKETTEDFNQIFRYLDAIMQEYLPGLTLVIIGHTRKADLIFRGPQVVGGDCDNMIYVERIERELKANVQCQFSRNASEFDDFGITLTPKGVTTEDGPQNFLAVTEKTAASIKSKSKTDKDEELAWSTLVTLYKGDDNWTPYTVWFEATKAARGGSLGNSTFSDKVKNLVAGGRVRLNEKGLYQVVFGAGERSSAGASSSSSHSPSKETGVGGVKEATPRSTPGVGSSSISAEPAKGEIEGEDDVAADAMKHLKTKPEKVW